MRRLVLGLLAALLVLASSPALASARSTTHKDPAGDTWVTEGEEGDINVPGPPTLTNGDITRVYLNHRRHVIRIIMTAREVHTTAQFDITNGRGQTLSVTLGADNSLGVRTIRHGSFYPSACTGIRHAVNVDAGTWALTVPRRCLHHPRLVRLRAFTAVDDAYTKFAPDDGLHDPGASPWVRRGHHRR
jgi:hypothetical protein